MPRRLLAILLVSAGCGGEVIEGTSAAQNPSSGATGSSGDAMTGPGPTGTSTTDVSTTNMPTTGTPTTGTPTTGEPVTTDEPVSTSEPDTTTGPDTTTEPAAVCGDGVVGGAEKCDDMNSDPLDGCTSQCAPPRSCLDLYTDDAALTDGMYAIDPEGDGTPLMVLCDMMNGGWTRVLEDGLSSADGWTGGQLSTCGGLGGILGGAGQLGAGASLEKMFGLLGVPHQEVRVHAEFAIIDSWDNEEIFIEVEGAKIASKACALNPGTCGQTKNECGAGNHFDGPFNLIGTAAHADDSVLLRFGSTLDEAASNEAWGLDTLLLFVK